MSENTSKNNGAPTVVDRNWDAMGISWKSEPVAKRMGTNNSDKRTLGNAEIPIPTDLAKLTAEFTAEVVLQWLNSTSIRVMAQDVGRTACERKWTVAENREAVYMRLKGTRRAGGGFGGVRYKSPLPDGTFYSGTDEADYQAQYTLILVEEHGLTVEQATGIARNMKLREEK